jgi:hypothetical protein
VQTVADFDEYWRLYLTHHRRRGTRLWHFAGTAVAVLSAVVGILQWNLGFLVAAPLIAVGVSFYSHRYIERNRSRWWEHPWWALRGDLLLCWLMLQRGLDADYRTLTEIPLKKHMKF